MRQEHHGNQHFRTDQRQSGQAGRRRLSPSSFTAGPRGRRGSQDRPHTHHAVAPSGFQADAGTDDDVSTDESSDDSVNEWGTYDEDGNHLNQQIDDGDPMAKEMAKWMRREERKEKKRAERAKQGGARKQAVRHEHPSKGFRTLSPPESPPSPVRDDTYETPALGQGSARPAKGAKGAGRAHREGADSDDAHSGSESPPPAGKKGQKGQKRTEGCEESAIGEPPGQVNTLTAFQASDEVLCAASIAACPSRGGTDEPSNPSVPPAAHPQTSSTADPSHTTTPSLLRHGWGQRGCPCGACRRRTGRPCGAQGPQKPAMGLRVIDGLPEFVRFSLSGAIGTLLDFIAYRYIYDSNVFPMYRATLSWASAYALSVIWQHALHAFFVFGGFGPTGYWRSLMTMYMAYSASIFFSPAINYALINYAHMIHQFAFLATLIITGILNYALLAKSMGGQSTPALVILAGGIPVNDYMHKTSPNAKSSAAERRQAEAHHQQFKRAGTVIIGAPANQGVCNIC